METPSLLEVLVGPEELDRAQAIVNDLAPRLDYWLVADLLQGRIQQWHPAPTGLPGPRIVRLGRSFLGNTVRALHLMPSICPDSIVYSTGETWGLPVALTSGLLRRHFVHVIYAHRVYSPFWQRLLRYLGWLMHVDGWICINSFQAQLLRNALGDQPCQIAVISQGVDTLFYDPTRANPPEEEPYILSVGAEMRDYPLFLAAVRSIEMPVVLKASSAWMSELRETPCGVPSSVMLLQRRLSYVELRDLYAGAALVVVPLYDTPQAAGITTILESMAMGKPVVLTRSRGLPDGLVSDENCVIVEPDPAQLAAAITALLNNPARMQAIASNGRRLALQSFNLEFYAQQVSDFLRAVANKR